MDLKRSIQGFVGFYNPCCSNMRRWCSVGTVRMGYKLDHLLRQNGNWKKPSTTSTTNSKIPKLPKFMKSPLKKKNFQKTPATQQKNKGHLSLCSWIFLFIFPSSVWFPIPLHLGLKGQPAGRWTSLVVRDPQMLPNSIFLKPKKRKGWVLLTSKSETWFYPGK